MKIFCSGIGGIGLSAYASLRRAGGHDVSGSDRSESALLDDLRSQGIGVTLDQSGKDVPANVDLFVYSEAIPVDAPERKKAAGLGIRQQSYPEAVGDLAREYSQLICVCGTHGKSSTTAMAARLLMHAGREPTVVVGTKLKELNDRNWRKGREGGVFLLEACEYRHSFHHYDPQVILLTTCDGDHFDFYESMDAYRQSFIAFVKKLPKDGVFITHMGDPDCEEVARSSERRVIDADGQPMIALKTPGKHMQQNAQLVLSLASLLDIPQKQAESAVSGYAGSWRRMEVKGISKEGAMVIDDYGHHPREIRATLNALKSEYPDKRLIVAFQPHTHDRTIKLYEDFTKAFTGIDTVIVTDVYEARKDIETDRVNLSEFTQDVARNSGVQCVAGGSLKEAEEQLHGILKSDDVLVCMGAGDITNLASVLSGISRIP